MFHEPRNSFQLWMSKRVGVTGLEPATLWSQTRCATNCATPRLYYHAISRPLKRYRLSPRLSCVCAIFLSFFLNLSQVFFFDCLNSSGYSFKLYITNFLQIYLVFPKQSTKKVVSSKVVVAEVTDSNGPRTFCRDACAYNTTTKTTFAVATGIEPVLSA